MINSEPGKRSRLTTEIDNQRSRMVLNVYTDGKVDVSVALDMPAPKPVLLAMQDAQGGTQEAKKAYIFTFLEHWRESEASNWIDRVGPHRGVMH